MRFNGFVQQAKQQGFYRPQHEVTQKYLDLGTEFVAVGVDTSVLMTSLRELLVNIKLMPK